MSHVLKGWTIQLVALAATVLASLADPVANSRLARTNLLQYVGVDGEIKPVVTIADWEQRRTQVIAAMTDVMGPLPGPEKRAPLDPRIDEEVDCGTFVRQSLTYQSEPGARVPAYLLIPKEALRSGAQRRAILCLHQTHALGQKVVVGLGNSTNDEYGVALAERGYVCLAPAYPLLANYQPDVKRLGYESGTMKAIWDNIRGLDLLETMPSVRKGAFGIIGHSLGGHNGIFTAVFDSRIKVVVSSCGFDSFRDYMGGNIKGWTSDRYMPKLLHYQLADIPFDFPELLGALAPRWCMISAPLRDTNFKTWSVDHVVAAARTIFDLSHVPEHLVLDHPDCGHVFPPEERERAYLLFDRHLK